MLTRGITLPGNNTKGGHALRPQPQQATHTRFSAGLSDWLFQKLPQPVNVNVGGMSIEDFSNRLMVWTIYIPQGIMAIKYRQHPFETWGRNIVIWLGMLGVTLVGKHDKYGFNPGFNQFMKPRVPVNTIVPQAELLRMKNNPMYRLMYFVKHPKQFLLTTVNSMRPTANYLAIAQEAGINLSPLGVKLSGDPAKRSAELAKAAEKALWSKIDVNEQNKLIVYKNSLINKLFTDKNRPKINPAPQGLMNRITYFWKNPSKLTGLLTGGLSAEDQLLQAARKKGWQKNLIRKIDSIEQISKRISSTKIMSVMAAALLMAVVVGVFLQKLVFMFIAPLDKHLVPKTKLKPKTGDDDDDATGFQKRMNSLIQSVPTGRRVNA